MNDLNIRLVNLEKRHGVGGDQDEQLRNVPLAFGLLSLASLASLIGCLIPFLESKKFKIIDNGTFLSSSMALSGGVLVYLSIGDILQSSQQEFIESNIVSSSSSLSKVASLGFFFLGILVYLGTKILFGRIFSSGSSHSTSHDSHNITNNNNNLTSRENTSSTTSEQEEVVEGGEEKGEANAVGLVESTSPTTTSTEKVGKGLNKQAIEIAITLGIHNFPEGVVLFSSALTSTQVGAAVAIGLILHKIPEGLIITIPYYQATRSKLKAFLLGFFGSTFFLFLGGLLSLAVFSVYWDPFIAGVILGLTSGVLFYIAIVSVIPLALKLDRSNDHFVFKVWFVIGVGIIALSQVVFSFV